MDFFRRFTFLFCAPAFDAEALEGHRLNEITIATTTTRRPITARCSSAAASRSISRPTAMPMG
jgi:hypothetical protein